MSKTSSRQQTQNYKAFTRKNGGWNTNAIKVQMKEHSRWFFEGECMMALPISQKIIMEAAQQTIVEDMTKGMKLPEIKEKYHNNLQRKYIQKNAYRMMGMTEEYDKFVEKYIGVDYKHYVMDWVISVGVCMKLKVIPNDMNNGVMSWYQKNHTHGCGKKKN